MFQALLRWVLSRQEDWQEVIPLAMKRGFASMERSKQHDIASKGGRAAHVRGTAHEWDSDEARLAGRKGGQMSHGGGRRSRR
jgi:hypothetical protein